MKRWLLCFLLFCSSLQGIELKRVILSTNNNPDYIEFWPIVAPLWNAMGLRPTLALVAHTESIVDTSIGDVILFKPLPDISEALQAQVIRLLLPSLYPNEGCLIADIDMLPISREYFFEGASKCPSEAFLVYRDRAYEKNRYPMCYIAAEGHIFGSVFCVDDFSQFAARIRAAASCGLGWATDELILYHCLVKWENLGNKVIRLGHHVEGRLDRSDWKLPQEIGYFIDCHCPRPYSSHKASIDKIVNEIYKWWDK